MRQFGTEMHQNAIGSARTRWGSLSATQTPNRSIRGRRWERGKEREREERGKGKGEGK